ncbi:hypothetical protein [Romboutsia sp.]|uniref:hypothetical protein n=1 Tax=Romboutsia sp. TaxID=1965302 RepID=UPI003F3526AC
MNFKFLDWYTQAIGATFGLMTCIYSYLNGYMFVYGNIGRNFDSLGFNGIISSYILFPLCIFTLILSFLKSLSKKSFCFKGINLYYLNMCTILTTIIVGFMGARLYFTIPAIFMILNLFNIFKSNTTIIEEPTESVIEGSQFDSNVDNTLCQKGEVISENIKILLTKKEMARELLVKNADKQFIMDITGLTKEEIESLEKEKNI